MVTCTKRYNDLPFAHRQHRHSGHCRLPHGHNWAFEFEFQAKEVDACGFVVDFGGLKPLRDWLVSNFDHTYVMNADDPLVNDARFVAIRAAYGDNVVVVQDCSCEGIAAYVLTNAKNIVSNLTQGRVTVSRVTVYEDSRNSATITDP